MIPDKLDSIVEENTKLLTSGYVNKPVITAILRAFLKEFQEIEDVSWDSMYARLLGHAFAKDVHKAGDVYPSDVAGAEIILINLDATGQALEMLGRLVLEDRNGLTDAAFQSVIRAKVKTNRSNGLAEDLIKITRLIVPPGTTFTYEEPSAANVVIRVLGTEAQYPTLKRLLNLARMGGVRLTVEVAPYSASGYFELSSVYGTTPGDTHGLSSVYGGAGSSPLISAQVVS